MSHSEDPDPPRPAGDPLAGEWVVDGWHVRVVQPYRALKHYRCPWCVQEIRPGTLHVVAWPEADPEERRHWHRPCWERHLAALRHDAARRARRRRRGL